MSRKEDQKLELICVRETGMTLEQNGKVMDPPLAGFDFAKVFWSVYFSNKRCCEDPREQVCT